MPTAAIFERWLFFAFIFQVFFAADVAANKQDRDIFSSILTILPAPSSPARCHLISSLRFFFRRFHQLSATILIFRHCPSPYCRHATPVATACAANAAPPAFAVFRLLPSLTPAVRRLHRRHVAHVRFAASPLVHVADAFSLLSSPFVFRHAFAADIFAQRYGVSMKAARCCPYMPAATIFARSAAIASDFSRADGASPALHARDITRVDERLSREVLFAITPATRRHAAAIPFSLMLTPRA